MESLFPQSCGAPALKPDLPSKPNGLGAPPPDAKTPQAGEPDMGLRTLLWEKFCDIIIFQFVGHPPNRYGI